MSACKLIEVASRNNERLLRLSQFNLYPEALADSYIIGHISGKNKINIKHTIFHFGNLILGAEKKKGLRIGYMEAGLQGFYLNSIETGIHPQKLSKLLTEEFHCTDNESATGLFQFLINEGDRVSYQIMLPYLLSTENINEFENIIQKRFFGVERFIRQGKNLYKFVKYTEERRDPIIWINDLEKGIIGWDMGLLVSLARASQACGHITKEKAWDYIEQAAKLCSLDLHTAEEIDKSFLLGKAMKSEKIEDWDRLLLCYSLLAKYRK